nr:MULTISPECIES: hypothetical protein [unclassified Pseudomonas]
MAIVVAAAFGLLGAAGAMIAALLHNLSMLLVLTNAGRLLRHAERLGPGNAVPAVKLSAEAHGTQHLFGYRTQAVWARSSLRRRLR